MGNPLQPGPVQKPPTVVELGQFMLEKHPDLAGQDPALVGQFFREKYPQDFGHVIDVEPATGAPMPGGMPPPPAPVMPTPQPMGAVDTALGVGKAAGRDAFSVAKGAAGTLPPEMGGTFQMEPPPPTANVASQAAQAATSGPAMLIPGIPKLTQSPEEQARKYMGMPPVGPLTQPQEAQMGEEMARRQEIEGIARQFGSVEAPPPLQANVSEEMGRGAAESILSFLSPASFLTIGAAGAAGRLAKVAAGNPKVLAALGNSPAALKMLDYLSENAVQLGFVGLAGKGSIEEFDAARQAYQAGDTATGAKHFTSALTNAAVAIAAGMHAGAKAGEVSARGPETITPEKIFKPVGPGEKVSGEIPTVRELKAKAAEQTKAGNPVTAKRFEQQAEAIKPSKKPGATEFTVDILGEKATVRRTGKKVAGGDFLEVVDKEGQVRYSGTAKEVREWARGQNVAAPPEKVTPPAQEFAEEVIREKAPKVGPKQAGEAVAEALGEGTIRPEKGQFTEKGVPRILEEKPAVVRTAEDIKRPDLTEVVGKVSEAQGRAPVGKPKPAESVGMPPVDVVGPSEFTTEEKEWLTQIAKSNDGKLSTSQIQRALKWNYGKASRAVTWQEQQGLGTPVGKRSEPIVEQPAEPVGMPPATVTQPGKAAPAVRQEEGIPTGAAEPRTIDLTQDPATGQWKTPESEVFTEGTTQWKAGETDFEVRRITAEDDPKQAAKGEFYSLRVYDPDSNETVGVRRGTKEQIRNYIQSEFGKQAKEPVGMPPVTVTQPGKAAPAVRQEKPPEHTAAPSETLTPQQKVAKASADIKAKGAARINDVDVKIIQHPAVTDRSAPKQYTVQATQRGQRMVYEGDPLTIEEAQQKAVDAITKMAGLKLPAAVPQVEALPGMSPLGIPEKGAETKAPADEAAVSAARAQQKIRIAISRAIQDGTKVDNPAFTKIADEAFGGSVAQGKYTTRDAYDMMESAVAEHFSQQKPSKLTLKNIQAVLDNLPTQTARTEEQVTHQQFSTPPPHAYVATMALNPRPGEVVLEPSAGTASMIAFVSALRGGSKADIYVNELSKRRAAILKNAGFTNVTTYDAEQINNLLDPSIKPTAIIMNPPFSATGGRINKTDTKFGFRHLESALQRLEKGGRLVAILGESAAFDRASQQPAWDRITSQYNVRANIGISGKNYRKYGTTFGSQLIIIDKNGPTKGASYGERLGNIKTGQFDDLAEVLNAIQPIAADRSEPSPDLGAVEQRPGNRGGSVRPQPGPTRSGERGNEPGRPAAQPAKQGERNEPSKGAGATTEPRPTTPEQSVSEREGAERGEAVRSGSGISPDVSGRNVRPNEPEVDESGTFSGYTPRSELAGVFPDHTGKMVESGPMAATAAPAITYRSSLPTYVAKDGLISNLQAESVFLAGQRFSQRLPDGSVAGFFLGDGTGVGKGRQISAMILDQRAQDRKKALWVSASTDLFADANRDMKDLRATDVPLKILNDWQTDTEVDIADGVVYSTYNTLIARSKSDKGRTRLDQLLNWLGDEPIIVLDEAHKAKNAMPGGRGQATKTGATVLDLQAKIPNARVVYSSATGATNVRNMAYMTRLGLWGPGTPFPGGFEQFLNTVEQGGVGAMEMVARDMKALGSYLSRSLSFEGVEYDEIIHELTPEQAQGWSAAAMVWRTIAQNMERALALTNQNAMAARNARSQFWGNHQRFASQLITAFKVPTTLKATEEALRNGETIVISLVGTGESRTTDQVSRAMDAGSDLEDLDFSPIETIRNYLEKMFPTAQFVEKPVEGTDKVIMVPLKDENGNIVENRAAVELKERLIDSLSQVRLPDNPLDQIINHFGPDKVAELTGRKRRLIRNKQTGRVEWVKRKVKGVAMEKMNLHEMRQLQNGTKRIAIISDAASTGISLHADLREKNQQRRVHIVLQLGWSADKQMQSFGRTHRSNQKQPPRYVIVSSDIGGEKRFSSTIASRLSSLGALTKGHRSAAGSGDTISKYDFESTYGSAAVFSTYARMLHGSVIPGLDGDPRDVLRRMGVLKETPNGGEQVSDSDMRSVKNFLNRILALDISEQNAMFEHFYSRFSEIVERAKEEGTFDDGIANVKAVSIRVKSKDVVYTDKTTGANTEHIALDVDKKSHKYGWDFAKAETKSGIRSGIYRSKKTGKYFAMRQAGTRTDEETGKVTRTFAMTRPDAAHFRYIAETDLLDNYEQETDLSVAKKWWDQAVTEIPEVKTTEMHVISGAILPLWSHFREVQGVRIVRMNADDGSRVLGVEIPNSEVGKVLSGLGIAQDVASGRDVYRAIYEQGGRLELGDRMMLHRSKYRGDDAIELLRADNYKTNELKQMGLLREQDGWTWRWFVPSDEVEAVKILDKLIARWPPRSRQAQGKTQSTAADFLQSESGESRLGDLARRTARATAIAWGWVKADTVPGRIVSRELKEWRKDSGVLFYTAHMPSYIAEIHPEFAPFYNRARRGFQEKNDIVSELHAILGPYYALSKKERSVLDGRLIRARRQKTNDIDEDGLSQPQKMAARAVRDAFDAALSHYESLAVDMATRGRFTSSAGMDDLGSIKEKLLAAGIPEKVAERNAEKLLGILEDIRAAKKAGYVPFSRFGDWEYGLVPADDPEGRAIQWERRESRLAADKRWKWMQQHYAKAIARGEYKLHPPHRSNKSAKGGMVPGLGASELWWLQRIARLDPEATEELAEAITQVQEARRRLGFRSHFTNSKETPGYETDLARPIADYIVGLASHISRAKMMRDMETYYDGIPARKARLKAYADDYVKYLRDPKAEAAWLRSILFHWFLGFGNPKAGLVQITQVPMVTYPWLLQYAGPATVAAELTRAQKDVAKIASVRGFQYAKLPRDVRADAMASLEDGTLQAQFARELGDVAHGRMRHPMWAKASRASGLIFTTGEHNNRLVTFIAAHRIFAKAKNRHGLKTAAEFAENAVDNTQYEYAAYNRAVWGRGKFAPFAVFKSFGVNYLETWLRLVHRGTSGTAGRPRNRRALGAAGAMMGILLMAAGYWGLPGAGEVADLYTVYQHVTGEKYDPEVAVQDIMAEMTSPEFADYAGYGMTRMTPFDLSASLGQGRPVGVGAAGRIAFGLGDVGDLTALTSVVGRAGEAARGVALGKERAIEGLVPTAISNVLKAKRMAHEGLRTSAGRKLPLGKKGPHEFSGLEIAGQAAGLRPTRASRAIQEDWRKRQLGGSDAEVKSALVLKVAKAIIDHDAESKREGLAELKRRKLADADTFKTIQQKVKFLKTPPGVAALRAVPKKHRKEASKSVIPGF